MRSRRPKTECKAYVKQTLCRPVKSLNRVTGLASLKKALRPSFGELAEVLGDYRDHDRVGQSYSRQYMCNLATGRQPITDDVRYAVIGLIQTNLPESVTVRARLGSRVWKLEARARCACGRAFTLARSNQKRCARCKRT